MSKLVKDRKAAQQSQVTLNKVVNGVNKVNHAKIKADPMDKYRQNFQARQLTVNYAKLYS